MKKASAVTAVLASTLGFGLTAHAAEAPNANPFAATSLSSGYQLAQADTKPMEEKAMEGKAMEGKTMDGKPMDGKPMDGSCGASKKAAGKKADGS